MKNCVIVAYGRSPIAKATKGTLAKAHPVDFGAEVLKGVLERVPKLALHEINDVIVGCAIPEGKMGLNLARNIVMRAGLPTEVPGMTINRFCASGLQSIAIGASMIMSGMQEVVVAGGVESMSQPFFSDQEMFLDQWLKDYTDVYMPMGLTAENVAEQYKITRSQMEEMAVDSHKKAIRAIEEGVFDEEIIPVQGTDAHGEKVIFCRDECCRAETNLEALTQLKPCFKEEGVVTAATSSQRSDGAAFVVLMSEQKAVSLGVKPLARFVGFSIQGLDPAYMGLGSVYAIEEVLEKSHLTLENMDVIELNETFASQALATMEALELDPKKVNPRGGALALGHPLGATGAILMSKTIHYLRQTKGKYGLITMCIGGGMGAAGIIEVIEEEE